RRGCLLWPTGSQNDSQHGEQADDYRVGAVHRAAGGQRSLPRRRFMDTIMVGQSPTIIQQTCGAAGLVITHIFAPPCKAT
ncbi:MAG: hypothetical protein Q7T47_04345, partial [Anaerolineales bacterium]|nr:hypothetical protein [Anaerolineales bacterium]